MWYVAWWTRSRTFVFDRFIVFCSLCLQRKIILILNFLYCVELSFPGWGPNPNFDLIRFSRPKLSLIRFSRRKLTLIRISIPKLPLIRLSRHKRLLIRIFRPKAFWSDHLQTIAQTLIRLWSNALEEFMIRPSCACSHLWSDCASEACSKAVLIRLKPARNSLIRERFYLWTNLLILLRCIHFKKTDVCSIQFK